VICVECPFCEREIPKNKGISRHLTAGDCTQDPRPVPGGDR
jgi:hypothetical protein